MTVILDPAVVLDFLKSVPEDRVEWAYNPDGSVDLNNTRVTLPIDPEVWNGTYGSGA